MSINEWQAQQREGEYQAAEEWNRAVAARHAREIACAERPGGHDWRKVEDPNPRLRYCRSVYVCHCGARRDF